MDHKVFGRGGFEQEVEIVPCESQSLSAALRYEDVVVGWNRAPDLEHGTLQRLVLVGHKSESTVVNMPF